MKTGMICGTIGLAALTLVACGKSDLSSLDTSDGVAAAPEMSGSTQKIKIVGSSTVSPFATTVAERFGATSGFSTPIVETTGTGGGFKAFCQGLGPDQPSISNASRPIKASETALCASNGVTEITPVEIGYDGIVVANSKNGPDFDITKTQLYLALAKDIPDGAGGFQPNPYKSWHDVDAGLPDEPIQVFGPPPTSGTRDAFVELGMEHGAESLPALDALKASDKKAFQVRAHTIRTDGAWIDAGENDTAIIQQLVKSPTAIGVLGYSFLEQNGDRVKGAQLAGVPATFENIASGDYGLSRIMYFYVKDQNLTLVPGLIDYIEAFTSDSAFGPDGYLVEKGLIPLTDEDRDAQRAVAESLKAAASN
ncbi:substrate-binding domain-containing protein [Hyphomonas johnsonii]|uniref:Putative phosphate ABC transporter periplasmic phosphate-binding protein n=1 Tax=Hyphomonas johnsonii MHS-2 TaxID=1280950 RepID=A0A059FJM4_9PROT|nr:substrate-binding domain-containing protein [Hyphomonas johnsonii]KCZ90673.1 putative phosphate ABC transporter periplasmic phosphate-binding protein [Hyphomonas johnsonii MHS-2]